MTDEELAELLGLVDEPAEDVPIAFERRLWDDLSATFHTTTSPNAASEPRGAASHRLEFTPVEELSSGRTRRAQWGSLVAAAAVAVLALGMLSIRSTNENTDEAAEPVTTRSPAATDVPATAPPTTAPADPPVEIGPPVNTTPSVLLDPVEACERFRVGVAPLVDLPDALAALEPSASAGVIQTAVDDVESVRLALITYAADLDAGDLINEAEARELTNASRTLAQALAEIDIGNLEAAARTVGAAQNATNNLLQTLDLPGLQYDAFGPTIDCFD